MKNKTTPITLQKSIDEYQSAKSLYYVGLVSLIDSNNERIFTEGKELFAWTTRLAAIDYYGQVKEQPDGWRTEYHEVPANEIGYVAMKHGIKVVCINPVFEEPKKICVKINFRDSGNKFNTGERIN
mgnify:FL=1